MSKQEYEFHPYASIFPMMSKTETNELAADIQAHGLRFDIILLDGKILDGRNRYKACRIVNVEPRFRDFNGDGDPVDYIVSVNLKRRQLNESQKGLVAGKLATLERGRPAESAKTPIKAAEKNPPQGGFTVAQAAKVVDVSERTVSRGKKILREAPKKTIKEIETGKKTLVQAEKEIKSAKEKTEKHFDKTGYPIPDGVWPDWKEADSYRSLVTEQHKIKLAVENALKERVLGFREINNGTVATLTNAWNELQLLIPYAICPTCQGRTRDNCTVCKQRGFVSEFGYKHWFPKKTIEIRERAINK